MRARAHWEGSVFQYLFFVFWVFFLLHWWGGGHGLSVLWHVCGGQSTTWSHATRGWPQVIGLGGLILYLMRHLASPQSYFSFNLSCSTYFIFQMSAPSEQYIVSKHMFLAKLTVRNRTVNSSNIAYIHMAFSI